MSLNEHPKPKPKNSLNNHSKHNKTSMHTLLSRSKFVQRPQINVGTPISTKKSYPRKQLVNNNQNILSRVDAKEKN